MAFPETSPLKTFQDKKSGAISRVSDNKEPVYRRMNVYIKSIKQYWKERNRRKKAWQLSSEGYTYKQIAEKLGVREKTVQRDMKKVRRYHIGQLNKSWRIMQEEQMAAWEKKLEGLSLSQQFKVTTRLLGEFMDRQREREYNRHLIKIVLDMDHLVHGVFPTIITWPKQKCLRVTLPIHVRIAFRVEGKDIKYGGFTIG